MSINFILLSILIYLKTFKFSSYGTYMFMEISSETLLFNWPDFFGKSRFFNTIFWNLTRICFLNFIFILILPVILHSKPMCMCMYRVLKRRWGRLANKKSFKPQFLMSIYYMGGGGGKLNTPPFCKKKKKKGIKIGGRNFFLGLTLPPSFKNLPMLMFANEKQRGGGYSIYMYNLKLETLKISLLSMHCIEFSNQSDRWCICKKHLLLLCQKNANFQHVFYHIKLWSFQMHCLFDIEILNYAKKEKNNTQIYLVIFSYFKKLNLDPVNISFNAE